MNRNTVLFILFCTVVPLLNFLIFYIYTNSSALIMAFTDNKGQATFDNFIRFGKELVNPDSQIRIAIKNTMITFAIGVVVFPGRVLVSYFIYKKIPGHKFYRVVFFLPTIIFSVAVALIFQRMIGTTGFIAQWIGDVAGLEKTPELLADSRFANYTIWAHMLWLGFPGDLIIWGGTFSRIPDDVLESARLDGASWWNEFTRIIIPMVWPTVALQMVLMTCGIFGSTGAVWLLTKGEFGTHTISSWTYKVLLENSGNAYSSNVYNYLSAVGLVFTVIAILLSIVIRRWSDKRFEEVEF